MNTQPLVIWCFLAVIAIGAIQLIDRSLNPPWGGKHPILYAGIAIIAILLGLFTGCAAPPSNNVGFCLACFERHAPEPGYGPIAAPDGWLCGRVSATRDTRPDATIGNHLGQPVGGKVFGNGRFDLNDNGRIDLRDWAINARIRRK